MAKSLEDALAACIDRIERGAATPEDAVLDYPEFSAELEPLLGLAAELRALPKVMAPRGLREEKRPVFAPHPRSVRADPARERLRWWIPPSLLPSFRFVSPLVAAAAALVLAVLVSGGTVVASAGSLPDDPLYPVKLAVESVQLALAQTPEAKADVALQIAGKRLDEVEAAVRQGKSATVERSLALYEDSVDSALTLDPATTRASEAESARRLDALDHQQETLERVYNQVPQQAQPAVLHALEVSKQGRGRLEKEQQGGSAGQPQPTAEATPTPAGSGVAPSATGVPREPDRGRAEPKDGTQVPSKGGPPDKASPSEKSRSERSEPAGSGGQGGPPDASGASGRSVPSNAEHPTTVPTAWSTAENSGDRIKSQEPSVVTDRGSSGRADPDSARGGNGSGDGSGRKQAGEDASQLSKLGELLKAWWPPLKWSPKSLASPTSKASADLPSATPTATAALWPPPPSTNATPTSNRPASAPVPSASRGSDGTPTSESDGVTVQGRAGSSVGDQRSQVRQQNGSGKGREQQSRDD